jgi:uncharacterized protein YdeI (YjbR/CyaY-like superfamily)
VLSLSFLYNRNMNSSDPYPILTFESQQQWEDWLKNNYASVRGIWMKIAKKDTGIPSINYAEALEGALIYGWIDGQKDKFDEQYWLQKFTPRRSKSPWSKINREKAELLIAVGRMQPAGLREVELAQADGRWEAAYDSQRTMEIPEDFQIELDKNPAAQEFFHSLNKANRYSFLYRIQTAKKPETRAARIAQLMDMLIKKQKFH